MYDYIKGILVESCISKVTIDIHGIGYRLQIPLNNYGQLPSEGAQVTLYISTVIREDAHKLFGFLSKQERDLFEDLIAVSGIGPRTALALIGHMELKDLQAAIAQGNVSLVCKIPGIGKKTAERLIIEMRDKILKVSDTASLSHSLAAGESKIITDAISALINLGYNKLQAQKAVKAAMRSNDEQPELAPLITAALLHI